MRPTSLLLALATLAPGLAAATPHWPVWRGPANDGTAPGATPPLIWSESRNVAWKVPVAGLGFSTPIVWGDRIYLLTAVETTEAWARRALAARRRIEDQSLFGIVQGGVDPELRREAAERTVALDLDGYALGGLSVGERRDEMLPAIEAAVAVLPDDRPRYRMGVGDPCSIVEAVARGIDLFDCVLPTRLARHGTLLTDDGRLNIGRAEFARDDRPIQDGCGCPTCARYERGLLRHLASVDEPALASLCTIHNLYWTLRLTERIRAAVRSGTLDALRREVGAAWCGTPG